MMLRILQKTGHKPIVLMGGGTTKVGDPSGRIRPPLLSNHEIDTNKNGIKHVFEKYLTFGDGTSDALMVDNADWLDDIHYVKFLRDYGPHFSINRMMGMESVKLRLDENSPCPFLNLTTPFCKHMISLNCAADMVANCRWADQTSGEIL